MTLRRCFDCGGMKPVDGFKAMGHRPGTRIVCADCVQKIKRERRKVKR